MAPSPIGKYSLGDGEIVCLILAQLLDPLDVGILDIYVRMGQNLLATSHALGVSRGVIHGTIRRFKMLLRKTASERSQAKTPDHDLVTRIMNLRGPLQERVIDSIKNPTLRDIKQMIRDIARSKAAREVDDSSDPPTPANVRKKHKDLLESIRRDLLPTKVEAQVRRRLRKLTKSKRRDLAQASKLFLEGRTEPGSRHT